jgi:membrane peptidoglycan carboxypeptidase
VTQPGLYHTAAAEGLPGIDFGGKTGTAQLMSHQALDKTNKGRATNPNVWFIGVTPTRNPELVVAVLYQNGNKSWFAARIGARIVSAYVEKQRRIANNLPAPKAAAPVGMTAVWTVPDQPTDSKSPNASPDRLQSGHFLIDHGQIVAANPVPSKPPTSRAPPLRLPSVARVGNLPASRPQPSRVPSTPDPQPAVAVSGKGR